MGNAETTVKPQISVIVPVYNVEAYLPHCVDSILAQTHQDLEVLLVDDGSPDNCPAICDAYAEKDCRVKVVHKKNGGVSSARNAGLAAATGEWIGFVDGDDWIEPDMYERLLHNATAYKAQISVCGMVNEWQGEVRAVGREGELRRLTGRQAQLELLERITLLPSLCNKIYDRRLVNALTNREGVTFTEDMLANYRVFGLSNFVVVDGTTKYHYVLHAGSAVYTDVNQGHLDAIIKAEEMWMKAQGDTELERLWQRRCAQLRISALNRIIKAGKLTDQFQPIRRDLLCRKWRILTSGMYTPREKIQTLALWLCPALYAQVVRRKRKI